MCVCVCSFELNRVLFTSRGVVEGIFKKKSKKNSFILSSVLFIHYLSNTHHKNIFINSIFYKNWSLSSLSHKTVRHTSPGVL